MTERMKFVARWSESEESFTRLCAEFGISRKTGYKWLDRFEQEGPGALENRAPVAERHPRQTPPELIDRVVLARKEHPFWGPKKLRAWLQEKEPELNWPAASTIGEALKQRGLVRPRRRRLRGPLNPNPLDPCAGPNDVWCADFKGHFQLGDGPRCHPLTITDACTRYLIKCEGLPNEKENLARVVFEQAFREFGLPRKIRSDNGQPFASVGLGGLSPLSVWWIKLGIEPERIDPGKPQQNGQHERMHRTLKEQLKPVASSLAEQQRALDRFRHEFNDERPHEALSMKPPKSRYALSMRPYPRVLRSPEYDSALQTRRVQEKGFFKMVRGARPRSSFSRRRNAGAAGSGREPLGSLLRTCASRPARRQFEDSGPEESRPPSPFLVGFRSRGSRRVTRHRKTLSPRIRSMLPEKPDNESQASRLCRHANGLYVDSTRDLLPKVPV